MGSKHRKEQLAKNKERKAAGLREKFWLQREKLLATGIHKPNAEILAARSKWLAENPGVTPPWIKYSRG